MNKRKKSNFFTAFLLNNTKQNKLHDLSAFVRGFYFVLLQLSFDGAAQQKIIVGIAKRFNRSEKSSANYSKRSFMIYWHKINEFNMNLAPQ